MAENSPPASSTPPGGPVRGIVEEASWPPSCKELEAAVARMDLIREGIGWRLAREPDCGEVVGIMSSSNLDLRAFVSTGWGEGGNVKSPSITVHFWDDGTDIHLVRADLAARRDDLDGDSEEDEDD